jgi:PAS domain S-box-containing protein
MSEKRFEHLMGKVTNFAIIFKGTDGIIQEWNVGAENLFGWKRVEAIGQSIKMIYTPDDRAKGESEKEMGTAAQNGYAEDERWHLRRDGSHFFASGLLHAIREEGELTGYVKIVRDLTERVQLELALEDAINSVDIRVEERTSELGEANKVLKLQVDKQQHNDLLRQTVMHRVISTQEDERKRISRDLHDHLGQELTALRLRMSLLRDKYAQSEDAGRDFAKIEEMAKNIDEQVEFLTWELRPAAMEELGLEVALQNFINEWSDHFEVPADFKIDRDSEKRLPPVAEINLYRIAQESLNNIAKHAEATHVKVTLADVDHSVALIIEDNGIGFKVEEKANKMKGIGLLGLGERAALLQGEVEIESAPGRGTVIQVLVPNNYDDHVTSQLNRVN